jgi:hypothetical protein
MIRKNCISMSTLLAICVVAVMSSAQSPATPASCTAAYEQLAARGEVYFSFELNKFDALALRNRLARLTSAVSIDKVDNGTVYAYANKEEFGKFLGFDLPFRVLTPQSLLTKVTMSHFKDFLSRKIPPAQSAKAAAASPPTNWFASRPTTPICK